MPKKRSPEEKKRRKLIRQKSKMNLDSCAHYLKIPAGFLRDHWEFGKASFGEIEEWLNIPRTERLLRMWEQRKRERIWVEGCMVRYVQRKQKIKTEFKDCAISRKEDRLLVRSGKRVFNFPLGTRTLEIQIPFSTEFKAAQEVFP